MSVSPSPGQGSTSGSISGVPNTGNTGNITASGNSWYDYKGLAQTWNKIPLLAIKKALFSKGNTVRTITKLILNSVLYDFNQTAEGGAVIVTPDLSAVEFVSPDDRIDYESMLNGSLGESFAESIEILKNDPISAWDRFSEWFGGYGSTIASLTENVTSCTLETIDGTSVTAIDVPHLEEITDMVSLLEMISTVSTAAHSNPLSLYHLDTASFGWALNMVSATTNNDGTTNTETLRIGFLFRE